MKNRIGKFNWHTEKQSSDYQPFDIQKGVPPFQKWEKKLQKGNQI
jgi:hypothetical protein